METPVNSVGGDGALGALCAGSNGTAKFPDSAAMVANSVLFPHRCDEGLSASLVIDKIATVTDINTPRARKALDKRLKRLRDHPQSLCVKGKILAITEVLNALENHYTSRIAIPIPSSTDTVKSNYLSICWNPTRQGDYGYLRIEYNPAKICCQDGIKFVQRIVQYLAGRTPNRFKNNTRVKRLDIAFDLVSSGFIADNYPLYLKRASKSRVVQGKGGAKTTYLGTRGSRYFIRDYPKPCVETGLHSRRIECQRNWRDKSGPCPADLPEWLLSDLRGWMLRLRTFDLQALPSCKEASEFKRLIRKGFTANEAIGKMSQDVAQSKAQVNGSSKALARALEKEKARLLKVLTPATVDVLTKQPVAKMLKGPEPRIVALPFQVQKCYPYVKK